MRVVRRGDGHHIDLVAQLLEHLAIVLKKLRALVLGEPRIGHASGTIHVTKTHRLHTLVLHQLTGIHPALAACADMRGAHPAIG